MTTAAKVKVRSGGGFVSLLDIMFPVGSIYLTYSNTNPSNTLGGTWVLYSADRYLRGGASNATAGATGGRNTISVSQMPAHTHIPYYDGTEPATGNANDDTPSRQYIHGGGNLWTSSAVQGPSKRLLNTSTGGGAPFYPRYATVFAWRRTA